MVQLRPILLLVVATFAMAQTPPRSAASAPLAAAQADMNRGDFHAAASSYQTLADKEPSLAEAHAGLVRSLLKLDEVDAAEQASRKATELLPQSALVLAAEGDVRFRRGLLAEAQDDYQAALRFDEKCARAWLGIGRVDAAESHREKSRQAFAHAHDLDPGDGDILYYWAIGLPFPQTVTQLQKHLAQYRDDEEKERHEREYVEFLKALAGRKVWIPAREVPSADIKLRAIVPTVKIGVRAYSVQVKLNDRATGNVMLDTGASGLTISSKLAEKAHATWLSDHSIEGVGNSGPTKGYEAWVEKVTIGPLEFHDCHVHVTPRGSADFDGMIGTDIFEKYLVKVDFLAHKLRLQPMPPALDRDSFTPFYRFGHIMLMPTSVGDTAHGLFVLDTGSVTNSMSPSLARQVGTLHSSEIPVNGMSGSVTNVFTMDETVLQFSRFRQPHENMIIFDLHGVSKDLGTEISGLIGFVTFKEMTITIDYRDGLIDFDSKP